MINFDFYTPTRVLFGADRENEAGKQVADGHHGEQSSGQCVA